jgi:hypothetical protein
MNMLVLVVERFMHMLVLMRFGEMQINADCHGRRRADQERARRFAKEREAPAQHR